MDIEFTAGRSGFSGTDFRMTTDKSQETAQRLSIRFMTYFGTWWLEPTFGVDWFNQVLGKGRTKTAVDTLIQLEINKDKYVQQITSFNSKIEKNVYSCSFKVKILNISDALELRLLATENGLVFSDQNGNGFNITS